ncbi:Clp protease ClpP [uncultured Bacteroides sp.]|jgi:ATP-dependent protease ClpP protease subunit|uniref:Clp protease ClpP n=1 Tax=uncultured Bacteroides sp. TaxID=162156 RepID=UPI0025D456CC|nr:Clp protease ClpP [uncultured Bacteroides sp.]
MNINDLQLVTGEARPGEAASIRFFGKVTAQSTARFNEEFEYLETVIRPSLIRVLINSEGGSVLHGMTTYATIQNSTIDTECVIEGMAASMGSVLWAAGKRSLMRDYSILMIHNPFLPSAEEGEASELVKAFTRQIETIYRKRFSLTAEQVQSIMAGETGKDGTYFDASLAVSAGIIPEKNILHTSPQLCEKVKNSISGLEDAGDIQNVMSKITAEAGNHPTPAQQNINLNTMNEERTIPFELGAVAASLGIKDKFEVTDVMSRISALMNVEASLTEANRKLTDAQTVIAGKDASIGNLQKDLAETVAKLSVFEKKEADEKKARIDKLVEDAVTAGKIEKENKEQWVEMAGSNYELAEKTLASIPAREKITHEIATDPDNVQAAKTAAKTAEEKMAEKVNAVVGESFEFKKMS